MSELVSPAASGPAALPPAPAKKPCRICATQIEFDALKCTTCESWQIGKDCVVCGVWIPKKAIRCEACNAFQNWRRRIPGSEVVLALIVSVLSLLGPAITAVLKVIQLPSKTTAQVIDATDINKNVDEYKHVLIVRVINGGGSSSLVRDARLDLTGVGAQVVELENMTPRNTEVPANGSTELTLFATQVRLDAGVTKEQIGLKLCTENVALLLNVDERNHFGTLVPLDEPLRIDKVSGLQIRDWVLERIAGDPTPCP